jgi:SAM-dependent methyltransferase
MRRSGSILVVFLCLSHALIALAQTPAASGKATLYQRLGGYDGIASYIPLVFPRVAQHPELSHLFRGHGADSQQRQFDIVTSFDAIHDQAHPDKVLQNIWEALKPGATYFMLDEAGSSNLEENLDHPLGPFLYAASVLLHDGVACAGRRRSGHHVGRTDRAPDARRSRIPKRNDEEVRAGYRACLLHRHKGVGRAAAYGAISQAVIVGQGGGPSSTSASATIIPRGELIDVRPGRH